MTGMPTELTSEKLLEHIIASLEDDKAEEIATIALAGKSEMADYMVVCTGRSTRQVSSIAEKLMDRLKQDFDRYCKVEGKDSGDWVLVDAGDIIVHVFRPEVREFYQLEKMWISPAAKTRQCLPPKMRLQICAVGRLRQGPELTLIEDYQTRFNRTGRALGLGPLTITEVEDKKGGGSQAEADLLLRAIPKGAHIIALDERGKTHSSPGFAKTLARLRDTGSQDVTFVIGGADGLAPSLRDQASQALSFGQMVWPHMMARVMLTEQLYRAATILAGGPYHRA